MPNNDKTAQALMGDDTAINPKPSTLLSLPGELRNQIYHHSLILGLKHQYLTYVSSNQIASTILDRNADEEDVSHAWYMAEDLCSAMEFELQVPQWMGCCKQVKKEAEGILYWDVLRFEELVRPEKEEEEDFESLAEFMVKPRMEDLFSKDEKDGMIKRKFSVYAPSMENLVLDREYREPEETARWEAFLRKNNVKGRRTGLVWFPEETGMLPIIWVVKGEEESEEEGREAEARCVRWDRAVV